MNFKVLAILIWCFPLTIFGQGIENDTIVLKEINIDSNKPEKLKTIKFGKGKGGGFVMMGKPEYIYLIEDIPESFIQEITIHFNYHWMNKNDEWFPKKTVDKTVFEVTLYEVSSENMLGQKINPEPIVITLEESKDLYPKMSIDLSEYKFYTKRFFITIERISPLQCEECYYYMPAHYVSKKKLFFHGNKNTIRISDNLQKEDNTILCHGLRCEVKTLTRDY